MNTLEIQHLTKTYSNGVKAIDHLSLTIQNGMFGLLGPNGAGKSSLMKTIAGLQTADSGHIFFNGTDVLQQPHHIKQHLGFLPQDFGVYTKTSAYDLLKHMALLKGLPHSRQTKEHLLYLLEKVNLSAQKHKDVHTFSGGMRQRFGIAQALIGNPKIIIVDEPTAGLDPEERHRFNNLLSEIGEEVIVILSTHLVEDVSNLCTRMAIIQNGRMLVQGHPHHLIQSLQGKVWQKHIHKNDLPLYQKTHQAITTRLNAGTLHLLVYANEHPGQGFESIPADLEHVYFTCIHHHYIPQV